MWRNLTIYFRETVGDLVFSHLATSGNYFAQMRGSGGLVAAAERRADAAERHADAAARGSPEGERRQLPSPPRGRGR